MLVVEAMIDAGVQIGLRAGPGPGAGVPDDERSIELARQTGSIRPELRNMVTTPGGTTSRGSTPWSGRGSAVAGGIVAACERSLALGEAARKQG